MIGKVCLGSLIRHDVRLRRQLNGYEFRDFIDLLCLASEGRDPAYLPAKKVKLLRQELGLSNDAQATGRIEKFAALELVEPQDDGGLLITFLLDEEEDDAPAYPSANGTSGNGHANGNGLNGNGNGLNGNGGPPRQKRRQYSTSPDAERARRAYHAKRSKENGGGQDSPYAGEDREVFHENLTGDESKPHGLSLGFDDQDQPKPHANGGENREVSRAHVGHSNTVSGVLKNSESSGDSITVGDGQNLTQTSRPNPPPPKGIPPPRPELQPQEVPAVRNRDVQIVMSATSDKPNYRNWWLAVWKHTYDVGRLDLWDQALAVFMDAVQVRPPAGPGSIQRPVFWLKGALLTLLDRAGVAYIPKGEQTAPVVEVSEEEAEDIRRTLAETKAQWDAEKPSDEETDTDAESEPGEEGGDADETA